MYANVCIVIFIHMFANELIGKHSELKDIVISFLFGNTIVDNGWYIQVAILLYSLFYIVSIWKGNTTQAHITFAIFIGLYFFLARKVGLHPVWYQTVWMFFLGVMIADHDRFFEQMENHKLAWLGVSSILFIVFCAMRSIDRFPSIIRLMFTINSEIAWIVMWICAIKARIFNSTIIAKILRWIGVLSFEIYIFQGLAFRISIYLIGNKYLALFVSIGLVLLISVCFNRLFSLIKNQIIGRSTTK